MSTEYQGTNELLLLDRLERYNGQICKKIKKYITNPQTKILDFGAGIGSLAKILRRDGFSVRCLEIDPTLKKVLYDQGFDTISDLADIPENSLEFIYSSNVLEHIENDLETLRVMHKKLKPKGKLFLYLPAFECLYTDFDKKIGHFRRYEHKSLLKKMEDSGFIVKEWGYADSLGFFATYILKKLKRGDNLITKRKLFLYDQIIFPISAILDNAFRGFLGKNIYIFGEKIEQVNDGTQN